MNYNFEGWNGFKSGSWNNEVNVRDFIVRNYTPYDGDEAFLEGPTQSTLELWDMVSELTRQEIAAGGVLDMDTSIVSTITSHGPAYLDKADRWFPDRQALQACIPPLRRHPYR